MIDKDNACPNCEYESESGDDESYGDGEYTTQFMCEKCDCEWTSYYKYHRKEVSEINTGPTYRIPPEHVYKGKEGFDRILKGLPGNGGQN